MQNEYYKNTWGVSQSAIKEFRYKSPKRWKEIWIDKQLDLDKDEEGFVFGSLVDTMLFTPSDLNNRFYIADSNKIPTGVPGKIVRAVYEKMMKENDNKIPEEVMEVKEIDNAELPDKEVVTTYHLKSLSASILEEAKAEEWNTNWHDETKVKKVIEKGNEYFGLLCNSGGKKVISSDTNLQALAVVNVLQKDKNVGHYFSDSNNVRNIFQLEVFDKHTNEDGETIPIKGAIDILHIDNQYRTLQVCDFKTTHHAFNFIESIKKFGYCDQLSFYNYILEKSIANPIFCEQIGISSNEKWTILEPINIVIDDTEMTPYIYEYDWKDIGISKFGNEKYLYSLFQTNNHNAKLRKGWIQILNEITWHINNNKWDYPYEVYQTGKIKVNLVNS
jgi:hypothetical protein